MSRKYGWAASVFALTLWAAASHAGDVVPLGTPTAAAGCCASGGCTNGCCHSEWCCPKYCFTIEKPPCIKYARVCPKPVCNPCDIEGYGYYPTCWRPWAYPPDYRHCPVPPPGALADQPPPLAEGPGIASDETLPAPNKAADPHPNR